MVKISTFCNAIASKCAVFPDKIIEKHVYTHNSTVSFCSNPEIWRPIGMDQTVTLSSRDRDKNAPCDLSGTCQIAP